VPRSGSAQGWLQRRAKRFVAKRLLKQGTSIWQTERQRIDEAIEKVEQAWSLTYDPNIAVQLCTMYDQANLNDRALALLRDAFRRNPRHALVRHHAAITLLRHGSGPDTRDFFDSVLKVDPDDAFARFVTALLDSYDVWVEDLVARIKSRHDGRPPFIISCPVWGQPFQEYFIRYICAAQLSTNNLPELAKRYSVHFVIFTTAETEKYLNAEPLFACLKEHASVRFIRYSEEQVNYGKAMEAHYGGEAVYYSERPLSFYYARNCKFALMSCAHYTALAAGRSTDALVSCQVADTILNDGALGRMAGLLETGVDAVLINCLQIEGEVLRPMLDHDFRRADGTLEISSEDCTKLLVDHLPAYNFASAGQLPQIPLRICWRVGSEGILVHGNHYHPIGLRPRNLGRPLHLSIDPIDSRFMDRTTLDVDRIHIVQDASIVGFSVEEGPAPEQLASPTGALAHSDVAFWLWGYWGRLRGPFFQSPLRFGKVASPEAWEKAEATASGVVDAIVRQAAQLEENHRVRRSWRL
jgi:hypothetical protein